MIRSMDLVHIFGQMVKLTRANGSMESNMEKLGSQTQKEEASSDIGKMESVLNGSMPKAQ